MSSNNALEQTRNDQDRTTHQPGEAGMGAALALARRARARVAKYAMDVLGHVPWLH